MAAEAQMKRSTRRYLARESVLPASRKSTRLDATSSGGGDGMRNPSASAASATPCGSCACRMTGSYARMMRASFQAAWKSTSKRGASGTRSVSCGARRRSSPSGWATSIVGCPSARRPFTVSSAWFWPPRHVRAVSM